MVLVTVRTIFVWTYPQNKSFLFNPAVSHTIQFENGYWLARRNGSQRQFSCYEAWKIVNISFTQPLNSLTNPTHRSGVTVHWLHFLLLYRNQTQVHHLFPEAEHFQKFVFPVAPSTFHFCITSYHSLTRPGTVSPLIVAGMFSCIFSHNLVVIRACDRSNSCCATLSWLVNSCRSSLQMIAMEITR